MVARKIVRKKSTPSAKAKPASKSSVSAVQEFENDILKLEEKLEKAREKELAASNKLLEREKGQLAKANTKLATLRERKRAIALKVKTKKTAANQSQLVKVSEAIVTAQEDITQRKGLLAKTRGLLALQKKSASKAKAVKKAIASIEKEWAQKETPSKKAAPTKTSTTKKAPSRKPASTPVSKVSSTTSTTVKRRGRPKKAESITPASPAGNTGTPKAAKAPVKKAPAKKSPSQASATKSTRKIPDKTLAKTKTAKPKPAEENILAAPITSGNVVATETKAPAPIQKGMQLESDPKKAEAQSAEKTLEPKKVNPADAMKSEPGRSIFDPATDM